MTEHIVVVTGASPVDPHVVATFPSDVIVLAADGGLDQARAAGLDPSGLIGDLDSISPEGLQWARQHATIDAHPIDKERTDTELALAFAARMNPSRLTLVGGGNRLDHTIAALGALGAPHLTSIPRLEAWWDGRHVTVLHGPGRAALQLAPGSLLTLLALHGPCSKVTIDGVRWPLDAVTLEPVVGWGVSNEVLDGPVDVSLSTGVLTIFDCPDDRPADEQPADQRTADQRKDTQ